MAVTNGVHINGGLKDDTAPEEDASISSLYTTRAINVLIGPNGASYTILQGMAEQHSGLLARMNQNKPGTPIELPEVDEDIAHTLIHFIFTKDYHTLGLGGIPEHARATAEFKRSVLTYCAARLCVIEPLEEVTKSKMEHFSKQISVFDIQEVVTEVAEKLPPNDIWFPEHLYRWIKGILQANDELVTDERLLDLVGNSPLFDKAIVRSVTEMYSEKNAALKFISNQGPSAESNVSVPIANGNHDAIVKQEEQTSDLAMATDEQAAEPVPAESEAIEGTPISAVNGFPSEHNLENGSEVQSPPSVSEDWSVKAVEVESTTIDSAVVPETDPMAVIDGPVVNGREDELAKNDNGGKATDSDVEAARAKTKKKKNKGKKKSVSETQVPA